MKRFTLERFLDQRKPFSHLLYILIITVVIVLVAVKNRSSMKFTDLISFFLLGLLQLEIFIFVARVIFKDLNTTIPGKEFTRILLIRFVVFIALCFVAAFVLILLFELFIGLINGEETSMIIRNFFVNEFDGWFKSTLGGLSFGAIVFIVIQWQDALKREQKLREENLVFQNETLKSQINPHFLFNSLNTVSSLIQSDPEKAEQFINNLSSVYRYVLENGQKDMVPLQSELDLLNRYFDLHRVRDEEKISLTIDYSDAGNYRILPVSLQILLENAIKHNSATREKPLKISVFFKDKHVVVMNNLQKKATQLKSTGIGLRNLAERIRLVTGKTLIVEENGKYFTAKIPLSE
jgi:hypothetical protein